MHKCGKDDDFLGTLRFAACAMVSKADLQSVLNRPPAEECEPDGSGSVRLVSIEEDEGQLVGLSYMVPRIDTLWRGPGWDNFATDGVAIPRNRLYVNQALGNRIKRTP